jgi:hypothetical protein
MTISGKFEGISYEESQIWYLINLFLEN